jgi:hypothetical protein
MTKEGLKLAAFLILLALYVAILTMMILHSPSRKKD